MSRFFGPIRQLGYVVDNLEAWLEHWLARGVGPWWCVDPVPVIDLKIAGEPAELEFAAAIAFSGETQLELIRQSCDRRSVYTEFLEANGGPGLHHVACWTSEFDEALARATERGLDVVQSGAIGGPDGRFAYLSARGEPLGATIEISETSGAKGDLFGELQRQAAAWDGTGDAIYRFGA